MSGAALGLVALAAAMHVVWNALAKSGRDQFVFLWSSVMVASVLMLGPAVAMVARSGLDPAATIPVVVTAALHAVYFFTLGQSYRLGDFSQVYPIARGLSVALVAVLGWLILDEHLSLVGAIGVGFVGAGVLALGVRAGSWTRGVSWAIVTGVLVSAYSLVDKVGVGYLDPLPYVVGLGLGTTLLLSPVIVFRRQALVVEWRLNWRKILLAAVFNLTAYLLVLYAFNLSKAAYVVAARELSIVMSVAVARLFLDEAQTPFRLAGAAVIVSGIVMIAFAR